MKGRRPLFVAVLLLSCLLVAPGAAAVKVHAPTHVFGFDVTILVDDVPFGANATLTFDGVAQTVKAGSTSSSAAWHKGDLRPGKHTWSVRVAYGSGGGAPQFVNGTVLIEDPSGIVGQLEALRVAVSKADKNASRAADEVMALTGSGDANATISMAGFLQELAVRIEELKATGDRLERLERNQTETASAVAGLRATTTEDLSEIQGLQSQTTDAARAASTWGIVAVTIGTVGSLLMLVAASILWVNGRARHREAMALLLAFAAKNGLTSESEELKIALEALGED